MLAELAIVPSAPVLVPELSGPDAVEVDGVRRAVCDAVDSLAATSRRWVAVGLDGMPRRFSAYGVDVPVRLGPACDDDAMPLAMLIAGWCRAAVDPAVDIRPMLIGQRTTGPDAARVGADLAASIADDPDPVGVLVVVDGSTALTPSAPGGGDRDSAHCLQTVIDSALTSADAAALAVLDPQECDDEGVAGRAVFGVLAGLCAGVDVDVTVRYSGAPYGVGYTVATWSPIGVRS